MVQKKNFRIIMIAAGMMASGLAFQNCSYDPGIAQAQARPAVQAASTKTLEATHETLIATTETHASVNLKPRNSSAYSMTAFETQD